LKPKKNIGPNIFEGILSGSPVSCFRFLFSMCWACFARTPELRQAGKKLIQALSTSI
jgi:hypothetical protein